METHSFIPHFSLFSDLRAAPAGWGTRKVSSSVYLGKPRSFRCIFGIYTSLEWMAQGNNVPDIQHALVAEIHSAILELETKIKKLRRQEEINSCTDIFLHWDYRNQDGGSTCTHERVKLLWFHSSTSLIWNTDYQLWGKKLWPYFGK